MKAFYVTVQDMWKYGNETVLVVDTDEIPGLILTYKGKESFATLEKNIQIGQTILVGSYSE